MTGKPSTPPTPQGRKTGPSPPKRHKSTKTATTQGNKSEKSGQKGLPPPPPPPRDPPRMLPRPWPMPFAAAEGRAVVQRQHQKTPKQSNTSRSTENKTNQSSKKRPKFPTPPSPFTTGATGTKTAENRSNPTSGPNKQRTVVRDAKKTSEEKSRSFLMLKLRFTPELEYRHYGASSLRKHENPIVMHLRKFMQRCIDVTGSDIVFRTFTSEKEFDYAYCLKNDKEAAEELLAHQVEKQRHSHEMLVKLEIGITLSQFKSGVYPWMKANSTFMIEHPYAKKQIETARIGFIRSKHPTDTYRLDYQQDLNAKLLQELSDMDEKAIKDTLMKETGDDSDFPSIRVITQFLSWDTGDIRLETRALVLECLKSDKKFVLRRMSKLFPTDSLFSFVPFSMPYDKNIPKASDVYASIIKHHMADVENQFTFPVIGISEENMNRETSAGMSMKELLEQDSSILSVEKTPGTKGIGKWNIITSREERTNAEKHFDDILNLAGTTMDLEDKIGKLPFRVDISPIPDDYMKRIINASVKDKGHTTGSIASSITSEETMNSIESRFENIATKCEDTIKHCGLTVKQLEDDHRSHWNAIKQEFQEERNEFKEFLTQFQKENNEKFTELFEFKKEQETENTQVQLEMATLRSEISHIRRQLKTDKCATDVKIKQLQSEMTDIKQTETIDFITASTEQGRSKNFNEETERSASSEDSVGRYSSDNSQMSYQLSADEEGPRIPDPDDNNAPDPMLKPAPDPAGVLQQE